MIEFNKNFSPEYGKVTTVSPLIRRLVAHNPSPFTFYGTGTYIVGKEGGEAHLAQRTPSLSYGKAKNPKNTPPSKIIGGGANHGSGGAQVAQRTPSLSYGKAENPKNTPPSKIKGGGANHGSGGAQVAQRAVDPPSKIKREAKPKVALIDPGPAMTSHIHGLEKFLETVTVSHILVTHNHVDHSPAAHPLKIITGAEIYAFDTGKQADIDNHAEEGRDQNFKPDHILRDGDVIEGDGWTLDVLHTPGHLSNHICFGLREEKALFTGDHVMGWSTSVVSQPDGDMGDYITSLEKLLDRDDEIYYPTHGAPIENPKPYVKSLIAHRRAREKQIMEAIEAGALTIPQMVSAIYSDIPSYLHPAAASSVLSHLIHMIEKGQITCEGDRGQSGVFTVL